MFAVQITIYLMNKILERHKNYSLHIMVVILGLTGILGKLITLETLELVWYRMFIAFISLFLFLYFKKEIFNIKKRDFIGILLIGSLVTLHWLCFFQAIKVSNVSVAVVSLATSSFFSAIIEPIFLKRKVLMSELILSLIVIFSLSIIMGTEFQYFWGYFFGILAAFLGTIITLFNAKYINKVSATKITMIEMLSGVIIVGVIILFDNNFTTFVSIPSNSDLLYLTILGIVCTSMVFVWMTEILKYITPYSLIMAINMEPIYSIIIALFIFQDSEYMSTSFYIGSTFIVTAVFIDGFLKNRHSSLK